MTAGASGVRATAACTSSASTTAGASRSVSFHATSTRSRSSVGQDVDVAKWRAGLFDQRRSAPEENARPLLDRCGIECAGVVAELDGQSPTRGHHDAERVVGGLHGLQFANPQAVGGGSLIVDRVVLEHHDAVEQVLPARQRRSQAWSWANDRNPKRRTRPGRPATPAATRPPRLACSPRRVPAGC